MWVVVSTVEVVVVGSTDEVVVVVPKKASEERKRWVVLIFDCGSLFFELFMIFKIIYTKLSFAIALGSSVT
ncbi:hypothetical protein DYU05_05770 [Mucilaginibacter terrenus]|uniref:Transmembrane protein n=1 Tax=Mucilaginibacter terrenus TaxID=2482727 RepID=A0A3E2NVW9_9SPHI|nr:hypothetical protein DYU05_05770 [Mucilaginibacter terrenus]